MSGGMGGAPGLGPRGGDDLEATLLRPASEWSGARACPIDVPGPVSEPSVRAVAAPPDASCGAAGPRDADDEAASERPPPGRNALLAAATPVLEAALRLRHRAQARLPDAAQVRARLLDALHRFERQAGEGGAPRAHRQAARYALCTLLDETVARTPWGAAAGWPRQGLLVTLHRDNVGGERFFAIAEQLLRDPARHVDLIELLALMLDLGFEGRYAVRADGRARLDAWRERLHAAARRCRPDDVATTDSAAARRGPAGPGGGSRRGVVAAVAGGLLVVVAGVLQERVLARRREAALQPVIAMLDGLQAPAVPAPPIARAAPPRATAQPRARLAPLLRPEIDAGLLDVDEDDASARVTLVGDRFYDPGEAAVRGDHRAVLARVARALDALPGVVVVAGHTDDRPVRSPSRLDTNEALSLERARRVAALLAATLADPSRLRIEGWADRRPRASNATEAGRARNRRVEITWQAPQPVPVPVPAGSADDAAPR